LECEYAAQWSVDKSSGVVTFDIAAKVAANYWTGIAFAPEPKMVNNKHSAFQ